MGSIKMNPTDNIKKMIKEMILPGTKEADDRILNDALSTFEQAGPYKSTRINPQIRIWIKRAVAAVIVFSILIPLGYGASRVIRKLMLKPAWRGGMVMDFKLDKDIHFDLRVGTDEEPEIILRHNIRFFVEEGQLLGTLRSAVRSWPKFKWRTRIDLLDAVGKKIASAEQVRENGGIKYQGRRREFDHNIHFSLGPWDDVLQEQVKTISVKYQQVSEDIAITPSAWIESGKLEVLHGRVTDADRQPVANATVQIREKRKKGQNSIAAKDVFTDGQGFYSFDEIRWSYRVGVVVYDEDPAGQNYYHQYKRLNRTLHGTQKIDFKFEEFPQGTAVLTGQIVKPDGSAATEFTVDVRNEVDWKDYSDQYLHSFGFKKYFVSSDGRFEMSGLAPGISSVGITLTGKEFERAEFNVKYFRLSCELMDGKITEVTNETLAKKAWYGRVLFEDGTPAVLPGATTKILVWSKGFDEGHTTATVDEEGYFTARFSEHALQRLKSEEVWLTINVTKSTRLFSEVQKEKFPFRLMSMDKEKAGTLNINRPAFYYGRILYEDGKPAGRITEYLGSLDDQGSFSAILTDEQHEKIRTGKYSLEIMHPSYEYERHSYPIGKFPAELLNRGHDAVKGYILPPENMTGEHRHLAQCLDSYDILETLGSLLQQWRAKHNGEFPKSLAPLSSYADVEVFTRIAENIEYQPGETTGHEAEIFPVAYDKTLLENINGTHVLFSNGDVKFLRRREIEIIDSY
jgi:hypothetical protein